MKTVFFDVDTQLDFLYPAGALYVPGAERIVEALGRLTQFAAARQIQIVSTADAHAEDDEEFKVWKPHCVVGTQGQQKVARAIVGRPLVLRSEAGALEDIRSDVAGAKQILVEKQKLDCFSNPNLDGLVEMLAADRYVVYGVVTEYCVQCAAFGLLRSGAQVEVVTDAVRGLREPEASAVIDRLLAEGGRQTTVEAVTNHR